MRGKIIIIWALFLISFTTLSFAESESEQSNSSLVLNQYYYSTPQNQFSDGYKCQDNQNDIFLNTITVFLGIYGLVIAILLGIGWFLNHKDIKDIKESVQQELKRDFGDKANNIVKETMKSCYDVPINEAREGVTKLENYVKNLKKAIETKQPIPSYPEENDNNKTKEKNVFDES